MSCINANIQILNKPLVLTIERKGELHVTVSLDSKPLSLNVVDVAKHPEIRVTLICGLSKSG